MARTLTCLYGNTVFQVLRIFWSLIENLTWVKMYPGEFSQHYSTTYHCIGLRRFLFMVWSTKNGKNVGWHSWANCFPRCWRTLCYVIECLPRAELPKWSKSALLATAMGSENVYLCTPFTQGHFWCHHCIPCLWKCGFWYTICHTLDILDQVTCVIVLMVAIMDAILNLTPSARDPDCPPKFFLLT